MKLSKIFLQSINDIFSWEIIKLALVIGIPLAFIWIGIGSLFWDSLVGVTSNFISWIPFSVLKANAAFLIGGFSWVIAILVTYALIMALFNVPIYKLLPQKRYELFSIVLIILIAVFWTLFAVFNWDFVYKELEKVLTWFPFQTLQEGVAALLAILVFYNLFVVSLYLVVLFFNKPFLEAIAEKDYPSAQKNAISKKSPGKVIARDIVIFFIFLLVCFPLFFVPFVNILVQIFLWAWLIKESYFLSAASLYAKDDEIERLNEHGLVKWAMAFVASVVNILPILNIFAPFFAQTMFFHWVMQNRK